MENKIELLQAELDAINLWDRLYVEIPQPDVIDKDACAARFPGEPRLFPNCMSPKCRVRAVVSMALGSAII
jgi:hypothetical protein